MRPMFLLLAAALFPARADQVLTGDNIRIYYSTTGVWNSGTYGAGFQIWSDAYGDFADMSYPGSPWQQISIQYQVEGSERTYGANHSDSTSFTTPLEADASVDSTLVAVHTFQAGDLGITKTETWESGDTLVNVWFTVTNAGDSEVTDLILMHGVDPDQDSASYGTTYTYIDRMDLSGDGVDDWIQAEGQESGLTVGYGLCDPEREEVGYSSWDATADATWTDPEGAGSDNTIHWRHFEDSIPAGETVEFAFLVVVGQDVDQAQERLLEDWRRDCGLTDLDDDGVDGVDAGGADCDDEDDTVYPDAVELCDAKDNDCDGSVDEDAVDTAPWYEDEDADGYGDPSVSFVTCPGPEGWVLDASDCDPSDATVHPGAPETCDGVDQDCDGVLDDDPEDGLVRYQDADGDGYGDAEVILRTCEEVSGWVEDATDCDDGSADIHPGADEICDGVDQDCDGIVDDDPVAYATWYRDSDGDGYGDATSTTEACSAPGGYVGDSTDCDDRKRSVYPGAMEVWYNDMDENCDGLSDYDQDMDGHETDDFDGDDCDDMNASVYPGATEVCDSTDNDCNGSVDDSTVDTALWYMDGDGDGYGDPATFEDTCPAPSGYVSDSTDCDDANAAISPVATETCDDVDQDCDGTVDDGASDATTWFLDSDGDGYGTRSTTRSCDLPSGYAADDGDCDDADATVHPGAEDIAGDGIDQDCAGGDEKDGDGDGYNGEAAGGKDCDDADATVNPGADEVWYDGVDQDCDEKDDYDVDGDGYGSSAYPEVGGTDCDDTAGLVNPGATEVWYDGVDTDCSGGSDYDADGDGADSDSFYGSDCDDTNGAIVPGAPETWYDGVDQDCSGGSDYDADGDGDESEDHGGIDCDDTNPDIWYGAPETWYDGVDQDCGGGDDFDADRDGYSQNEDCDDADPSSYPGAPGWSADCRPLSGDTGDTGEEGKEGTGCGGCSSGATPSLGLWAGLLGLFASSRRRRRTRA